MRFIWELVLLAGGNVFLNVISEFEELNYRIKL